MNETSRRNFRFYTVCSCLATDLHYDCGYRMVLWTMAPAQKKVVVRTFAGALAWGYLPQGRFVHENSLELMGFDGRITIIPINEIRTICYVKDFNLNDRLDPERIGRRFFPSRPRAGGLWLKLTFRDDDILEGLASFDLVFANAMIEDRGIFFTPPEARSNTQRIFVPRSALRLLEVLGFVTAPSKRLAAKSTVQSNGDTQASLFDE